MQKKREEEEVETLQQRVLTSSQSATEQLEGLQAEATEAEATLATLTEEKNRWTKQLEEAEKEVGATERREGRRSRRWRAVGRRLRSAFG